MSVEFMADKPGWAKCDGCGAEYEVEPSVTCQYCGENYFIGHAYHGGLTYYPEAENMFWRHASKSVRHNKMMDLMARDQKALLDKTSATILHARTIQRRMEDPTYRALTRLFR